jgi:hypothetical protein
MNTQTLLEEGLNPMEIAAIAAAQPVPDSWRPYYFDRRGNGILIKGCDTTVYTQGKKAGERKFLTKEHAKDVVVTPEMSAPFEDEFQTLLDQQA